jgi:PKD repeat protein
VYTKPEAATYTVTVTMTDKNASGGNLGTSSGTAMVAVNSGNELTALLSVNPTLAQIGQDVTFNGCASFTADDETITKYVLDPDGSGSLPAIDGGTDCTFTYAYASAGSYTPTLTVSDSTGASAKVSVESVMIQTPPSPGTGGGTGGGTDVGGVNNRSGGGALGWLTLLPFGVAAGLARRRAIRFG